MQHVENGVPVANTTAEVADNVVISAGAMSISALGSDDNQASSSPGSGGLVAGAAAIADTTSNAVTQAVLGDGAQVTLTKAATRLAGESAAAFAAYQATAGRFAMTSDHLARANTVIVTSAYGVLAGSGAEADNTISSTSNVIIGNNARVTAYAINATSLNRFDKPNIGDNVNGSTGGLFAGAGVTSDTHLTLNTTTLVNDYAQLKVIGTSIDAGEFTLAARNDITFYENVSYKGGGLGSGIGAESKLDADNVFATVQIGTDTASNNHVELNTVGQMDLRADAGANAEMHVSVDNYGGVTVSVADATIDISPTNSILVGKGSHIKALSDVNMLAGMDTDNNHDVYRVAVYSDTFAGSVIPIDHVVADALLYQHNVITIAAGALVESGGNVRLFADDSPFADMMAQGKAVNWASSLVGAIDKALGGNAYAQTKGTAHSDTHGVVTVDGTVRTGLNRNINIVFDSTGDKDNLQIFYSGEGSDSVSMHVDESPLQSSYFDLIADAEEKKLEYSGNQDLIDFYDREIARMVSELEFLGLAEEVPVLNSDGTQTVIDGVPQFGWIPVKKNVLTIHVDPILASAGYIDIRADVLQGQGTLDAPGNVTVSIVNKTVAFLDIGGIYIPENNGGVFFNGFQNEISRINSGETDPAAVRALLNGVIADQNQANANDDNSDDQRGGEPVLVPGTVNLDITRTYDTAAKNTVLVKNTLNADLVGVPWPGITVSGDIDAITASVTLDNSVGSGDITITADIHSAALNVITGGMVIIDLPPGSVLNTGGDPYDAWKQITDPDGMGEASDTDRDAELAKAPTSGIYASLISINAEYVNLNGLIQSGSSDYVLNIGAATIAEIDQIKKDIASGKIQGGRVLLETVNYNEFKAYWDSDLGKIVIQEFRTPVGSITITGKLMNTGNGQIKALGAYVNVTVNNASDYDLLIRRIDVTERGLGTIILNDKSKRDDGGYTQTWYQTQLDGTVDVRVVDFTPVVGALGANGEPVATKKMVETGGVTSINVAGQHDGTWDYVATYNPQQGWRYGWSVATKTLESVTTTYGTSAWIGIDALARDPDNVVDTKYKLLEEPTLVPGSDYFYKSNVSDAYTHNSVTVVLSKTEPKLIDKWETSTWYGKTTYYQKYLVEQRLQETATNSIEADRPVQISFIGYEEATVKINSTGAGKVIIDNGIYNDTGLTQIVSNTTIEARNDNSVVQGVRITLDGNLGVGTGIRPLQIDLVDQYPVGYSRSTAYAYLTGHSANGDIYVKERYGDMSINTVVADKGNVTLTSHAGIVVADSAENTYLQGLVKGASITLVADTYVDAQGALPAGMQGGVGNSALRPLQLDSGDSNDDKVNISAEGDIFVSEIAGDLHLVRAVTHGNVWIEVRSGSLLDSDYVSVKDKRTYDELKAGVWTDLQLTGDTGAQDKINATLLGYELTQRGGYDTYWRLKQSADSDGHVTLSDAEKQYYLDTLSPQDATAAIATLEASRTAQLAELAETYASYGAAYRPEIEAVYKDVEASYDRYWGYRHTQADSTSYDPDTAVGLTDGERADYAVLNEVFGSLGETNEDTSRFMSAAIKADYDRYWEYRNGQADSTKFDPEYVVKIVGQELIDLTDELTVKGQASGLSGDALDAFIANGIQIERNIRTGEYHKLDEQFGALGETQKDASRTFGYKLLFAVGEEATKLTGTVKVWTENELLNAFGSGLTKSVTDTEVVIENANIIGNKIEIHAARNIGNVQGEMQIDLGNGADAQHHALTDDQRVALAAAERQDIVYVGGYQSAPGTISSAYLEGQLVDFAATGADQGKITLTTGNWPAGMFKAGDLLYVAGNTQNVTEDNAYFTVVSVAGNVITVEAAPGQSVVSELGRTVTLAAVVDDPMSETASITRIIINRREDIDLTAGGAVTAKAGGAVYLGSETTVQLGNIVAGQGNSDGDTIRIKTGGSLVNVATSGVNLDGSDILLEAGKGHIGEDGKPVTVTMRGEGGLIARAQDDVRMTAPTSDLRVESVYSKSGNAYLVASAKSILDALPGSTATKVQAQHIWLSAAGSIGTSADALEVDVTGDVSNTSDRGTLIATAGGSIFLTETHGDMNVRGIHSINEDVTLVAVEGSILDAEKPDPAYNRDIPDANVDGVVTRALVLPKADVIGRNISLTAHIGIGTVGNELDIDSSSLSSGPGTVSAHTELGSIYLIETLGDLILNEIGSGMAGADAFDKAVAFVTAVNGSILNGRSDGLANIVSRKTYLFASKSIGTASKRVTTAVSNLESWSYTDDTWIGNLGALEVGGVRTETNGVNAGGGAYIMASSPIVITESSIAQRAELEFWAEDDKEGTHVGDDDLPDDITVAAGVTLEASEGEVRLLAGDDIYMDATATIISPTRIVIVGDYQRGVADPDPDIGSTIELYGTLQAPQIDISGGGDDDTILIDVVALRGNTFIHGGEGNDLVTINKLPAMTTYKGEDVAPGVNGLPAFDRDTTGRIVRDELTIDGEGGTDRVVVNIAGASDYVMNIHDSGAGDDGVDTLTIEGTEVADTFLFRKNFVAHLVPDGSGGYLPSVERINYDAATNGRVQVEGNDGDDRFYFDDNSAILTVDGGLGNDFFQVGQIFGSSRNEKVDADGKLDPDNGAYAILSEEDRFETVETTLGYLSKGITVPAVLYGGVGEDMFVVYSNHADLRLEGEDGNDEFVIRAFALADGVNVKVNGGNGDDVIQYNINAPVDIDGGAGFDRVVVLGTELADTFVITRDGVYGAGLTVRISNAEALDVDGLEGDDTFYVLSTADNLVTTLIGGLGSDTFNVAGDVVMPVISDDANGDSGTITHTVTSADPRYNGLFTPGIDLTTKGSTAVAVDIGDGLTVKEDDVASVDSYMLTLPMAPVAGTIAYVTVSAAQASAQQRARQGETILVSLTGNDGDWHEAVTVAFTDGDWAGQRIYVKAISDDAEEGKTVVAISHSVINRNADGSAAALDNFQIPNVLVTVIDDDKPDVVITESGGGTSVFEGDAAGDTYTVVLSKEPAEGEIVTVTLTANSGQIGLSQTTISFARTASAGVFAWNDAQTIRVTSPSDGTPENRQVITVTHTVTSSDPADGVYADVDSQKVSVEVVDSDTASVQIIETDGHTSVSKAGETDSYQIVLTTQPTAPVTVRIAIDGQAKVDLTKSPRVEQDGDGYFVTFDATNWDQAVTVSLMFDETGTTPPDGVRVFSQQPHDLTRIGGPLFVDGGVGTEDRSLTPSVALPDEFNPEVIRQIEVDDGTDVDQLVVFSDTAQAPLSGVLTDTHISGLGMPSDPLAVDYNDGNPPVDIARGITYSNLQVVEVLLGVADDSFTIESTAEQTLTVVHGGGGSDTLTVTGSTGPVVLFGDTSANGERYSSIPGTPNGTAYGFLNTGDDIIDASGARGVVVIDGGAGKDTLTGGHGTNFIAGGADADTIFGGVDGKNWIIGDSSFDVDYRDRTVIIDDDGVNAQGETETAGADIITGGNLGDVIIGDHGIITQQATIDGSDLVLVAGTLDMMIDRAVVKVETSNPSVGGDDVIDAGKGPNIVFGGFGSDILKSTGGQDLIVGDNGSAEFANGLPTIVQTTDPEFGGADQITSAGGRNILVGGSEGDTIQVLGGSDNDIGDVVLGDNGVIVFDDEGNVTSIESTDPGYYGDDVIETGAGDNIVIAGSGNDRVTSKGGDDVILGDNGKATFENNILLRIESTLATFVGPDGPIAYDDVIDAGDGRNVVFGGNGDDEITAGDGDSVILGDNGLAIFDSLGRRVSVETTDVAYGGDDIITIATGDHVLMGGSFDDEITAGGGNDVILGDNGIALYEEGKMVSVRSAWTEFDGVDVIDAGDGSHVVFGGGEGDGITIGTGNSVVFGDSGYAEFDDTLPTLAYSIDTGKGGVDTIQTGDGDQIVAGGVDGDFITTGAGSDVIFGDNARFEFAIVTIAGKRVADLQRGYVISPLDGGDDIIDAGASNDIVVGGTGADEIHGGSGDDRLFGDHALFDLTLPENQRVISIYIGAQDGGGNDTIYGDEGDDIIVGQQGDDTLFGGDGDDDITGGHNVIGGADGDDTIYGGKGEDVILGDNGLIARKVVGGTSWKDTVWQLDPPVPGKADSLLRDVIRFDLIDGVGGDDEIHGGADDDRIFGQRGDDSLYGDDGIDEIVGGLGSDTIDGGAGVDYLLGDEGQILRAYNADGSALLNSDGSWHRDVVLEEVATLVSIVSLSSSKTVSRTDLASNLLDPDMLLVGGVVDANGVKVTLAGGTWDTQALGIDLEVAYDDTIDGGEGNDVIFGQRGNDTLNGGDGDDTIFGDRASNGSGFQTDLPKIVNAYRIIGADAALGIELPLEGELVVPGVNLLPQELTNALPQIELLPGAAGFLGEFAARNDVTRTDGNRIEIFASVLADVTRVGDLAYGSDTIDGGAGNDTIFGDDGRITTITETGLAVIDKEIAGLSVSLNGLLQDLASLGFAKNALDADPNAAIVDVTVGGDTIFGGDGDDTIFGDTGTIVVPATSLTLVGESLTAAALSLHGWLMDFQTVVADLSYTAHAAGEQVIADFGVKTNTPATAFAAGKTELRAATHRLDIGNDTIHGGDGNDLVVGDHGVMVLPVVSAANAGTLAGVATTELNAVNKALAAQDKTLTAVLKAHISRDHAIDANANKIGNWLFGNGLGYALNVGNDQLFGDDGDDVLIGDVGLIEQPMLMIGSAKSTAKKIADGLQDAFFKTIDRLYLGNISAAKASAEAWGVQATLGKKTADWSKNGSTSSWLLDAKDKRQAQRPDADYIVLNNDLMEGGVGNDLMFGDMAAVIPVITATTTDGMIQSMRVLPVGETGATVTATLRYVYNFGAFGPLHGAVTKDVNARSPFSIDADRLIGGDGDDVLYGLLGDDYLSGGDGNDQLSGGNGYDTVNGGIGTNIYAFDRKRDSVEAGGGKDVVRQTLDAGSASLVLGRDWISPLMVQLGADARAAAASLVPTGLNAVRIGKAAKLPKGISATPKVINAVVEAPHYRPTADLEYVAGFDATTLPSEDEVAPDNRMLAQAGLFMTFAAQAPLKATQANDTASAAPEAGSSVASPSELISGIRSGDIVIEGMTAIPLALAGAMSGLGNVAIKVSEEAGPDLDLDVLFFDTDTGSFVPQVDADDDIAFH
ncbi:MAG: calcium-binding protein [Mesorhizobium sp.]